MDDRPAPLPWFTGVWQRDGISVPGRPFVEPCEAWWVQSDRWFVDIRRTRPGHEHNDLPYSQTRIMAGWFHQADGWSEWHVLLDSARVTPAVDRAAAEGLNRSADEPDLMIEHAPGRFTERWRDRSSGGAVTGSHADDSILVRLGPWTALAERRADGAIAASLTHDRQLVIELVIPDAPDRPIGYVASAHALEQSDTDLGRVGRTGYRGAVCTSAWPNRRRSACQAGSDLRAAGVLVAGVAQDPAQHRLDELELGIAGDQRWGQGDDRLATVVGAADQPRLDDAR